jgi:hypothetical protein
MTTYSFNGERGASTGLVIAVVALGLLSAGAIVAAIWGIMNYMDQKTDVDGKISVAVIDAKKVQADELEAKFAARDKEPNREFVGPDDYGRLTFNYPKTWSVYIDKDVTQGGTYAAYLNPVSVPPIVATQQYALRVTIEERDYDKVITGYASLVKKGDLKSSAVSADGSNGTRLDGSFSKDIRGSAVVYKIRDKTVTLRTDADTFKVDFDALIATIQFNQ